MNTHHSLACVASVAFGLLACSSAENSPAARFEVGLLSACEGSYLCAFPDGSSIETQLEREGEDCRAGKVILNADGSTSASGVTWSGDRNVFSFCADGECATCESDAVVEAP